MRFGHRTCNLRVGFMGTNTSLPDWKTFLTQIPVSSIEEEEDLYVTPVVFQGLTRVAEFIIGPAWDNDNDNDTDAPLCLW